MKKHLFTKPICSLTLAVTLLCSNGLTTFAKPANDVYTVPLDEYSVEEHGWISLEVTTVANADKSEYFFTSESALKLNCIDAERLPGSTTGTTSAVVIFYPDSAMKQRGINPEDWIANDIYDENLNIIEDVYVRTTPYSFGDACKIVTPDLIASVNKSGSGMLLMGISDGNVTFEIDDNGRYMQWYPVTSNDFILDDNQPASTEALQPAILPSESQEVETESISATPTNEIPVQTNNSDIVYTVAKYDTLGVIALNYYGSYEASKQLYDVNKDVLKQNNNRLKEGIQLKLPTVLGNYSLIAPPQLTGNEKLYSVKAGDTLRKIAQNEYGDSSLYQALFDRNTDRIKDVNHIYEGLIIVCP